MTNFDIAKMFFLQIGVVLASCRLLGLVAKKLGQPEVVGQIFAGIILGPSLLGLFLPDVQEWLFPQPSRAVIYVMGQLGLSIYMFLMGLEFRIDLLRTKIKAAALISTAGIVVPFALGMLLAAFLHGKTGFFGDGISQLQAMAFLGAATSITAFPVMASIISERGLTNTYIGTLLLTAGAVDDAVAWCALAVVLSMVSGSPGPVAFAIGGGLVYVAIAMLVLRPAMRWLAGSEAERNTGAWPAPAGKLLVVLVVLAMCSWFTDTIGIYAVFGAFVLGLVMPRGWFAEAIRGMLMPVTSVLLVPMFFVVSGLNTRIALVDSFAMWGFAAITVATACAGKLLACAAAAKMSGEGTRQSLAIGSMMNARGMMELIILNIGLERGIITPTLFSIGIIMTIVTTLMASPMFDWFYRRPESLDAGREIKPLERPGAHPSTGEKHRNLLSE